MSEPSGYCPIRKTHWYGFSQVAWDKKRKDWRSYCPECGAWLDPDEHNLIK